VRHSLLKCIGLTVLTIILIMLPLILGEREYYVGLAIVFLINLIMAVSYRLIATTGDFSLAHLSLMGCGSYSSALMLKYFGWSFWLTLPLAALTSALVGLVIAFPLLRMRGFGFFIGSYAIAEAIRLSWIKFKIFGGHRGLIGISPPSSFTNVVSYYYLTLVIAVLCLAFMYLIDRLRTGDILKAIHSQDSLVWSVGINVRAYRALAFVIGAFFAGVAGVLLAHYYGHIDPAQFNLMNSLYLLIWVVVGGVTTFAGPIIGVTFFTIIREVLRSFHEWMPLIYGFILIISLFLLPGGFESLLDRLWFLKRSPRLVKKLKKEKTDR